MNQDRTETAGIPLSVPVPPDLRISDRLADNAPEAVVPSHRVVYPMFVGGRYAVYELHPGKFTVMRNGAWLDSPFKSKDPHIAVAVCKEWEVEL